MADDDITILFIDSEERQYNRQSLRQTSHYFSILLGGSFGVLFADDHKYEVPITLIDFELYLSYSRGEIEVSSSNYLTLYKAALFLGGGRPGEKDLLGVCDKWLLDRVLNENVGDLKLDDTVRFWDFGRNHLCRWMSNACESHICRNFMWATSHDAFVMLPADLLWNCLQSNELTVDSERHLYDALIVWLLANKTQEKMETYNLICSCIRTCALPPQFMKEASKKLHLSIDNVDMNSRLRLSPYSKKMDLYGCSNVTTRNLFKSLLQDETVDFFPANFLENWPSDIRWPVGFPMIKFKKMMEINISKCHSLNPYPTIDFFQKSFSCLKKLKMSHFLTLNTFDICQILLKLCLLEELDLSLDIHPMVSTLCHWTHYMPCAFSHTIRPVRPSDCHHDEHDIESSRLKSLVLVGRTDLTDDLLCHIGDFASRLCHLNITGCTLLSDPGMSRLLGKCKNLNSFLAADTALSDNSLARLRQRNWTILDISGCQGLSSHTKVISDSQLSSLDVVMANSSGIKELGLRGIPLYDGSLTQIGCDLVKLNVSGTSLSEATISSLLQRSCKLEELSIGYGLTAVENLSPSLKTINLGLGAILPRNWLTTIGQQCPNLESISLTLQGISHQSFAEAGKYLTCLKALSLRCCFVLIPEHGIPILKKKSSVLKDEEADIASMLKKDEDLLKMEAIAHYFPALLNLTLEGVAPLLRNSTLRVLIGKCPNITELGLRGCKLLNSDTMEVITSGWPLLVRLHLKDCGSITVNGVGSLFDLKGMEDLLLCHNGVGIDQNFILQARSHLPSLRVLSLDQCDFLGNVEIPRESGGAALRFLLLVTCGQVDHMFPKKKSCSITEVYEWSSQRQGSLNHWKFEGPIQQANLSDLRRQVDNRYLKTSSKSYGISVVYGDLES